MAILGNSAKLLIGDRVIRDVNTNLFRKLSNHILNSESSSGLPIKLESVTRTQHAMNMMPISEIVITITMPTDELIDIMK
jgi:hypothetical protein